MEYLLLTCDCGQVMKVKASALKKRGICINCGKSIKITKKNTTPVEQGPATTPPLPSFPEDTAPASDSAVADILTSSASQTPEEPWDDASRISPEDTSAAGPAVEEDSPGPYDYVSAEPVMEESGQNGPLPSASLSPSGAAPMPPPVALDPLDDSPIPPPPPADILEPEDTADQPVITPGRPPFAAILDDEAQMDQSAANAPPPPADIVAPDVAEAPPPAAMVARPQTAPPISVTPGPTVPAAPPPMPSTLAPLVPGTEYEFHGSAGGLWVRQLLLSLCVTAWLGCLFAGVILLIGPSVGLPISKNILLAILAFLGFAGMSYGVVATVSGLLRWGARNTELAGERLEFRGSGLAFLGWVVLSPLCTAITCGLAGFVLPYLFIKWLLKNMYWRDNAFEFKTNFIECWAMMFVYLSLIPGLTFGLMFPWGIKHWTKWLCRKTTIEGRELEFNGSAMPLFGWMVLNIVLFPVHALTLGFTASWIAVRLAKWNIRNLHFIGHADIQPLSDIDDPLAA